MKHSIFAFWAVLLLAPALAWGHPGHGAPTSNFQVVSIAGKPISAGAPPTLEFERSGTASGNAGCNTFTTRYSVRGSSVRFEPAATTRKVCPPPAMETERAFLSALANARRYQVSGDGNRLELADASGKILMVLRREA